jgi:phage recombination protein Bet
MSTELAVRDSAQLTVVTGEQLDLIKRTIAPDATPDELQLFLYDCARQGTHPLDRMIHFTKRGRNGKYTPITSIDFMRQRAADSGEYAGNDDAVYTGKPGTPEFAASVTIWRLVQGQKCSFTATARWSEYKPEVGPSGKADMMWLKLGHVMLSKCAEALALRKAFPKQTAKLCAAEEIAQAGFSMTQPHAPTASAIRPPQALPKKATPPPTRAPNTEALQGEEAQAQGADNDAPEPGSNDAGEEPLDGIGITEIKFKKGESKKGPWTCYFIHGNDGKCYTTFAEDVSKKAQGAMEAGATVLITAAAPKKSKDGTQEFFPIMDLK